jgi:tetratricopeptide (TPR) repeat protein
MQQQRYVPAEAEYREAIRLDPDYAVAHNNLGDVLRKTNRYAEAEVAYAEALRLDPALTVAQQNLDEVRKSRRR